MCTAMQALTDLHTVAKLKVGAAGAPAPYRNTYQNTFIAVTAPALHTVHLPKNNDVNHKATRIFL